jgi:hypothetical protein
VLFIKGDVLQESLDKILHEFAYLPFHSPLLVEYPLFIPLECYLFFLELLQFSIVDFIDVFEFFFEVFILLFHFGDGGSGDVELVIDATEFGLLLTEEVVEFFLLLIEFLYLVGFEGKELESVLLEFLYFLLKSSFYRRILL